MSILLSSVTICSSPPYPLSCLEVSSFHAIIWSFPDNLSAFDQDINAKASLAFPQLYTRGILGLEYTRSKFWLYMFDGFYQSVIVYFIPYLSFSEGASFSWSGKTLDSLADFGTTVAIAAIFSANIFVGLNTR
jgi:phospholipid-translocating ATPase